MSQGGWDEVFDFVVIGSGAAGFSGAITAAASGARALMLEASDKLGGTTAISGGILWAPCHGKSACAAQDRRELAVRYLVGASSDADKHLAAAFVDEAAPTVEFLERATPLRVRAIDYPDSLAESPGGMADGRHLETVPFSRRRLGRWKDKLRRGTIPVPLCASEAHNTHLSSRPYSALLRNLLRIAYRRLFEISVLGNALIASLFKGAVDLGVTIRLNSRVTDIVADNGRVVGVVVQSPEGAKRIAASKGVLLACGGFEWNAELVKRYLSVPLSVLPTPPLARGDNIHLADRVEARLERMSECWHWPAFALPDAAPGAQNGSLVMADRALPHSIWVNERGRRFVNEAAHNAAAELYRTSEDSGAPLNLPAWMICDSNYRAKYILAGKLLPHTKDPFWLIRAETLTALADKIGVSPALEETVRHFNTLAEGSVDTDFGRGRAIYERYRGDPKSKHPNLGTIAKPPFYAIRVHPSAIGTRGGPKTNRHAQVEDANGNPIPGFYAAGNAAAFMSGGNMLSAGGTIMPAMTFARLAVIHAMK